MGEEGRGATIIHDVWTTRIRCGTTEIHVKSFAFVFELLDLKQMYVFIYFANTLKIVFECYKNVHIQLYTKAKHL